MVNILLYICHYLIVSLMLYVWRKHGSVNQGSLMTCLTTTAAFILPDLADEEVALPFI